MERLILFARRPELGRVKTRLAPPATPLQALALYEAFLDDQVRFTASLGRAGRAVEICLDRPWSVPRALAATEQGPGDLGERMLRALRRARAGGAEATVIIGADAPSLPAGHVEEAFDLLARGADAVIAPAEDGGYVLVGVREPHAALFEGLPWGTRGIAALTRGRARDAGLALAEIATWRDADRWEDLPPLLRDLRADPNRSPATARVLAALLDAPNAPMV